MMKITMGNLKMVGRIDCSCTTNMVELSLEAGVIVDEMNT